MTGFPLQFGSAAIEVHRLSGALPFRSTAFPGYRVSGVLLEPAHGFADQFQLGQYELLVFFR